MVEKLATFRSDKDTWDRFIAKAKSNGTNASALLQGFVQAYLDNESIQTSIQPDIDVNLDERIDEAVSKAIANLKASINLEFIDIKSELADMHEAIATSKKAPVLSPHLKAVALEKILQLA